MDNRERDRELKKVKFLAALRGPAAGQPRLACRIAGWNKSSAYRERERDPQFAADWDAACKEGEPEKINVLEATAFERAVYGVAKPVYRAYHKWDEEDPDILAAAKKDPMAALALTKLSRNIIGFEHIPPSDRLLELLLKAENRGKYNPAKTEVTISDAATNSFAAEVKAVCEANGVEFDQEDFDRFLQQMAREYMAARGTTSEKVQ
jgi:hypothetical protein